MYNTQLTPPSFDYSMVNFGDYQRGVATLDESPMHINFIPESAADSVVGTPPMTPVLLSGPRLIPKVRIQDQITEPTAAIGNCVSSTGFPITPNSHIQRNDTQTWASPATAFQNQTPVSDTSPCFHLAGPNPYQPISFDNTPSRPAMYHGRSVSDSAIPNRAQPSHTAKLSVSNIDDTTLFRYGYPTYRDVPRGYSVTPQIVSALSHLMPSPMSGLPSSSVASFSQVRPITPPQFQQAAMTDIHAATTNAQAVTTTAQAAAMTAKAASNSPRLNMVTYNNPPPDQLCDNSLAGQSTLTLQDYLSTPNPSPSLVQRLMEPIGSHSTHFWYDVRNIRQWSDFNVNTISAIPGLLPSLQLPLSTSALPTPLKRSEDPENIGQLYELLRDHLAVRVNAALKVCLGSNALEMRSLQTTSSSAGTTASVPHNTRPEFLATCRSDSEKTVESQLQIQPQQRGRVVGIVKAYEQWNSGMRASGPANQVRFLAGLSTLHSYMRQHGCRYGFVITEIELVCVRYGGDNGAAIPCFGHLELSKPIRLSTHYPSPSQQRQPLQMTAALALLYLHLLAGTQPLPGQYSWKLEIGSAAARTRRKHLERDSWMPKPNQREMRDARRNRGWIWPSDPLNIRERERRRR